MSFFKIASDNFDCIIFSTKINHLFGLVPEYDHLTGTLLKKQKWYCFVWVLLHLACVCYYFYDCISILVRNSSAQIHITESILRVLDILGFSLVPALGIFKSFIHSQSWVEFFRNLKDVNKLLKLKKTHANHQIFIQFYLVFIVGHLVIVIMIALTILFNNPFDTDFLAVIYFWETYTIFLYNAFMTVSALFLYSGFKNLNEILRNIGGFSGIQLTLQEIKYMEKTFATLSAATEYYNAIFGTQVLFLTGYIIVDLLDIVNLLIIHLMDNLEKFPLYIYHEVFYFLLLMITYSCIIFSCDLTKRQSSTFPKLCYKIQGFYQGKPQLRSELLILAKSCHFLGPSFSAAGFVEFDRKIFLMIVNTVLVYLIIVINFNSTDPKFIDSNNNQSIH